MQILGLYSEGIVAEHHNVGQHVFGEAAFVFLFKTGVGSCLRIGFKGQIERDALFWTPALLGLAFDGAPVYGIVQAADRIQTDAGLPVAREGELGTGFGDAGPGEGQLKTLVAHCL